MDIHSILSPFVHLKFHNENNIKKKANTANPEFKRRVIDWGLNVSALTGRHQCRR